ncbi:MAG: hypothetical protein SFU99_15860 [Saprospiraceae bacterium]|nr:hypothetical protein [Saprospiraceae bacterium]
MANFDAIIFQYLETVERQLRENKPAEVGMTLHRLKEEGFTDQEAKRMIAQCVAQEMYQVMESDGPYNELRYIEMLHQLPNLPNMEKE